jgi:hypothetical protein
MEDDFAPAGGFHDAQKKTINLYREAGKKNDLPEMERLEAMIRTWYGEWEGLIGEVRGTLKPGGSTYHTSRPSDKETDEQDARAQFEAECGKVAEEFGEEVDCSEEAYQFWLGVPKLVDAQVEEELSHHYEAVRDPFYEGHFTIVKVKNGEKRKKTVDEEQYAKMPLLEKIGMRYFWRFLGF